MIEKQSDNVENLKDNVSEEVNKNEDSSVIENQTSEDKQSLDGDDENIYAEDLKNTITNNDARLEQLENCLLYTSPSPRDRTRSRMPSSA